MTPHRRPARSLLYGAPSTGGDSEGTRRLAADDLDRMARGRPPLRDPEGTGTLSLDELLLLDDPDPAPHDESGEHTDRTPNPDHQATRIAPFPTRVREDEVITNVTAARPEVAARQRQRESLTPPPVEEHTGKRDISKVRRFVDSVVTAIPRAVKATVARVTGNTGKTTLPVEQPYVRDETAWRTLRALKLTVDIIDKDLDAAMRAGEVSVLTAARDDLVDGESHALVIVEGQLALAQLPGATLADEKKAQASVKPLDKKAAKKEQKRRADLGPMIRRASRNLAFFEPGDLVQLRIPEGGEGDLALAIYATTPVTCVRIARVRLELWQRSSRLFADRVRRASMVARERIEAVVGARAEVADFFIRHGLSVAQMLRVRQIDACIECGACEDACETRYGAKRLTLNGKVLGGLDFVDACHTCTDQRCIDPCAFDAIKYDAVKKEVVIVEAACTGCTLCATACPYNAIEMHDLDDKPLLKIRLDRENKLEFGDGAPRKAKLKRMASKCDHCIDYGDQACISACPTGALFDVIPGDVFRVRDASVTDSARAGFDVTVHVDARRLHDPAPFTSGPSKAQVRGMDRARGLRPGFAISTWMWWLGMIAWSLCALEIALRKLAPTVSLQFVLATALDHLEPEIAAARVDFRPGCAFAVRLGIAGSLIMLVGMLYPARRRIRLFANLGSQRAWFDVHVVTGIVGPLFVLLHTAAKLDNWVSLAFWSMAGTVLSGLAGRYFFTRLPDWASAASLEILDVSRRLDLLRDRHPAVRKVDEWFAHYQQQLQEQTSHGAVRSLGALVKDLVNARSRRADLVKRLDVLGPLLGGECLRCGLDLARYERRRVIYPALDPICRRWKLVHVPLAIALTLIGGLHIVLALL